MTGREPKIQEVPTLKPTLKEFQNFREYTEKLFKNPAYLNYGAVKVIS
jgi:hypothetical protein